MTDSFDAYLFFDGDCRDALEFYCAAFGVAPSGVMTYGEAPGASPAQVDRDRIICTSLPVCGANLMLSDVPTGTPYVKGSNVSLSLGIDNKDEITRLVTALSVGGTVHQPLGPQFFSPWYAMFTDKFGVRWQISQPAAAAG